MNAYACLAFLTPTAPELLIILILAVIIFGDRLPEVAKNTGKHLASLKRALNDASTLKNDMLGDVSALKNDMLNQASGIKNEILNQTSAIKDDLTSQAHDLTTQVQKAAEIPKIDEIKKEITGQS